MALEWAGAYSTVEKVFPKSDAHRAVNPLGMAPALDISLEQPMTQADATFQSIAERYADGVDLGMKNDVNSRFFQ